MTHIIKYGALLSLSLAIPQICLGQNTSDATFPEAGQCYTLQPCQAAGSCIQEESDGSLSIGPLDPATRSYWEFIPTGEPNRYYIRNLTTGHYIQSTHIEQSAPINAGTEAVEFYLGQDNTAGATTNGYWYMSSTDNAVFDQVSDQTIGLNRGGNGTTVVAYMCGSGRGNSYWNFVESEYLYEVHPFNSSALFNEITTEYDIVNSKGNALTAPTDDSAISAQPIDNDSDQSWYFVGTSNAENGYLIVSTDSKRPIGESNTLATDSLGGTHWCVYEQAVDGSVYYVFRPYENNGAFGNALTVDGDSLFTFSQRRSKYQLALKIYNLPCGTTSNTYLRELSMEGEAVVRPITFPIGTLSTNGRTILHTVTKPSTVFNIFTKDRAVLARGKSFTLRTTYYPVNPEGYEMFAYFDWNGDGVFEVTIPFTQDGTAYTANVSVPADATASSTRMRIRLTDNGLTGAEDDTHGQVQDFVVYTVEVPEAYTVTAKTSSEFRGTVSISPESETYEPGTSVTVTATPIATMNRFVCWRDGNNVVSTDDEYTFTVEHNVDLTAYFRPSSRVVPLGIGEATQNDGIDIQVSYDNREIEVTANAPIKSVKVFDAKGALVAQTTGSHVSLKSAATGTYLVNVTTDSQSSTAKIQIR